MRRGFHVFMLAVLGCAAVGVGQTWRFVPSLSERQMTVTRTYELTLPPGRASTVFLPAMMSFYGATNDQEIIRSDWTYSVPPDATALAADETDMPRKYYRLTWNDPPAGGVRVEQTMTVHLRCRNRLHTTAPYPYDPSVLAAFPDSLGDDANGTVVATEAALEPICRRIIDSRPATAEEAVQRVCDWVNDTIQFGPVGTSSSRVLTERTGHCGGMAMLACAILRHMNIPAEVVYGKFLRRNTGYHGFIEVYFPDAGWVFYDLSNWQRGFKIPNCLLTAGRNYRIETEGDPPQWVNGYFCTETDLAPYKKPAPIRLIPLRQGPATKEVQGVTVTDQPAPASVPVRRRSLRALMLDTTVAPGVRPSVQQGGNDEQS